MSAKLFMPLWVWLALLAGGLALPAAGIEKPSAPIIYADGHGGILVFWFYPGLHEKAMGSISGVPARGACPGTADQRMAVLTRFEIIPPVWVESLSTYILNQDYFPESPGDQFTQLRLALRTRLPGEDTSTIWNGLIGLDSGVTGKGKLVQCPVDFAVRDVFKIWTSQEWLDGFPTAPIVGLNSTFDNLFRYICSLSDPSLPPTECYESFMIGVKVLNWVGDDSTSPEPGFEEPAFKVLFSQDTGDFINDAVELDSVGADSLCSSIDSSWGGYLAIAAEQGDLREISEFRYLDRRLVPLLELSSFSPEPPDWHGSVRKGVFRITNRGEKNVTVEIDGEGSIIRIEPDSIELESGEFSEVIVSLNDSVVVDSGFGTYLVLTTGPDQYPIIYRFSFQENPQTDITDENNSGRPADFQLGDPFPNPFNAGVSFTIRRQSGESISLSIFDILGRLISKKSIAGSYRGTIKWNGRDDRKYPAPSGIYFFYFSQGEKSIVKRAVLLK